MEPGEPATDFALPRGPDGTVVRFSSRAGGRPAVVALAGGDPGAVRAVVAELADDPSMRLGDVDAVVGTPDGQDDPFDGVDVHAVVDPDAPGGVAAHEFVDHEGRVQGAWGVDADAGPTVVVLDPRLRAVGIHDVTGDAVAGVAAAVRSELAAVARAHEGDGRPAPVLVVPEAIGAEMAERVVAAWATADPVATGVETTADGRRLEALDRLRKRRRDLVVTDSGLLRALTQHVGRRIIPAVEQAFAFRATGFEGFKVGGYDAEDRGFFAAHRDNLSPATAHRRFALSLNLTDDHEGGELVFPEYGRRRHHLAAREALVFSGSLLHAVTPVTSGRRLVLLSFLFGADHAHR